MDRFETRTGFPQVVGTIDGTHIPILKPDHSPSNNYNRKLIMQAVVDGSGLFLDAYIGWPGKVHDARDLVNSTFYKKLCQTNFYPTGRDSCVVFIFCY